MNKNQQIKEYHKFINKNWNIILEIFNKGLQDYFDSINLLNISCLRCKKYSDKTCGGWGWKEDQLTHQCINFIDIKEE